MTRALGEVGEPIAKKYRPKKAPVPLKQRNDERQARLEEKNFGEHAVMIRRQSCVVAEFAHPSLRTPCSGVIQACHLIPRKMGGCGGGDRLSLFPGCERHHGEQEGKTAKFQARYGLDLAVLVEVYNLRDLRGLTDEEREAARVRLAKLREPR